MRCGLSLRRLPCISLPCTAFRALLASCIAAATVGELAPEPAAVFCDFDCGSHGRPSKPGVCFKEDVVYETHQQGWLLLKTRALQSSGPNARPAAVLPEWDALIQADMTWEGYFRLPAPPAGTSSLMGTYGSNHDTDLYYIDVSRRRRHAAVWVDAAGALSLNTNVGVSSGHVAGANVPVADGRWHHVAAVFQRSGGGAQVTFRMKVTQLEYGLLFQVLGLLPEFELSIKRQVGLAADTSVDHISLVIEDAWIGPLRAVYVYVTINVPTEHGEAMRDRLSNVPWLRDEVAKAVMNTPRVYNAIPTGPTTIVVTSELSLPQLQLAGSARLYIDGFAGDGTLTLAPLADNIGMDGQLVVGGGHQGQAIDCEVSRFRVWSAALAPAQVRQLLSCEIPGLPAFTGGAWPHDLRAAYALDGSPADGAGTGFQALESVKGGQFAIGGLCSKGRCPAVSPEGCLHVVGREVRFHTMEKCEAFARWVHCRVAGANRGRPFDLTGCIAPAR